MSDSRAQTKYDIFMTTEAQITDFLTRGVAEVIGGEHLAKQLKAGEAIIVKLGIDPTSPHLHLGHAAVLLKLRDAQELGCKVHFVIGDFTAEIGDTSDKESERPMLSTREVKANLKSYLLQAGKILISRKAKIHYNSRWLKKLSYREILAQANVFSLHQFTERVNIKRRLDAGKRISLRELMYPLMQGYDSVMIGAGLELGATDQKFNILAGRTLQEHYKQRPQGVLLLDLLPSTDGTKMSKSKGNTINVLDEPNDMFGKLMRVHDEHIVQYLYAVTRVPTATVRMYQEALVDGSKGPRDIKMKMAHAVTALIHGAPAADKAASEFVRVFSEKEKPEEIVVFTIVGARAISSVLVEIKFAASKSEARRLIEQQGVKINDVMVTDPEMEVPNGALIQKGKRFFARITK